MNADARPWPRRCRLHASHHPHPLTAAGSCWARLGSCPVTRTMRRAASARSQTTPTGGQDGQMPAPSVGTARAAARLLANVPPPRVVPPRRWHTCVRRELCRVRSCGSSGTVAVLPGGFASSGGIQSSIEPDVRRCVERMLALQAGIRLDTSSGQGPAPAGSRHDQCPGYAAITLATLTWPGGRIVVG